MKRKRIYFFLWLGIFFSLPCRAETPSHLVVTEPLYYEEVLAKFRANSHVLIVRTQSADGLIYVRLESRVLEREIAVRGVASISELPSNTMIFESVDVITDALENDQFYALLSQLRQRGATLTDPQPSLSIIRILIRPADLGAITHPWIRMIRPIPSRLCGATIERQSRANGSAHVPLSGVSNSFSNPPDQTFIVE